MSGIVCRAREASFDSPPKSGSTSIAPNQAKSGSPILRVFASWRMAVVLLTGFASGLPNALTAGTLQAWLTRGGVRLEAIGLFALVALPYSLKFLWSPLTDRFPPPFLGRRRGWIVISQVALILGICALAWTGVANPWLTGAVALAVAFFSASQDIAVDAYRTELLGPEELGAGAGLYIMGYRIGLIASTVLALMLARWLPWPAVYLLMAGAMLIGLVTTVLAPEPVVTVAPPRSLAAAIVQPFAEFLGRRGAVEMLLFILVFKLDWMMVKAMMTPFILGLGFTEFHLGVANGLGLFTTILGAGKGMRCPVHPGGSRPQRETRRPRQRVGARHVCRRRGKAARRVAQVSAPRVIGRHLHTIVGEIPWQK